MTICHLLAKAEQRAENRMREEEVEGKMEILEDAFNGEEAFAIKRCLIER